MRVRWRVCAIAVVLALAVVACGDDGTSGDAVDEQPGDGTSPSQPVSGGTLTMAVVAPTRGFDPIMHNGSGEVGGTELLAVYDQLISWNPETNTYDPGTAESVEPNDDFTVWTIRLRPGITFGDGTPYDAEAVKFNIERQKADSASNRGYLTTVDQIAVLDSLTVEITLSESWSAFRSLLSGAVGMIASPKAVQELGAERLAVEPSLAGAGPYELTTFRAGEAVVLRKKADYWGGEPYLDELRFVHFPNGDVAYEAFKAGEVQVALLREPKAVSDTVADGVDGFDVSLPVGEMIAINNGVTVTCQGGEPAALCAGEPDQTQVRTTPPGADPDVRRAMLLAINVETVNERANDGAGAPALSLFGETFPWDPDVPRPDADMDEATALVATAKSRGWDGRVRLVCNTDSASRRNTATAVEAMLESAGMDVTIEPVADTSVVVRQVIQLKDYDLACWGLTGTPDEWSQAQIDAHLRSSSTSNRTGYSSPAMDAALDDLKSAATDEARTSAYRTIAELWFEDVPTVVLTHNQLRAIWSPNVHDVAGTSLSNIRFHQAWLAK